MSSPSFRRLDEPHSIRALRLKMDARRTFEGLNEPFCSIRRAPGRLDSARGAGRKLARVTVSC